MRTLVSPLLPVKLLWNFLLLLCKRFFFSIVLLRLMGCIIFEHAFFFQNIRLKNSQPYVVS